jgi:hypothetical protein
MLTCVFAFSKYNTLVAEADNSDSTDAEIVVEPGYNSEQENTDAKQSAESEETASPRPAILGMMLEEVDGRVQVTDVGATTPAWDGGVRKGDVIVSLHGLKVESYQEWIKGVRKVVTDAVDGQTIPLEIVRDGSLVELQIRIPEQEADGIQRDTEQSSAVVNQFPAPLIPGEQPVPAGGPYTVGGGVAVAPFGIDGGLSSDGSDADQVPLQAVARLQATNKLTTATGLPSTRGVAPGTFPNAPQSANGRNVGVAEFMDVPNGLVVSVRLGGLPPGSYRVGIGPAGADGTLPVAGRGRQNRRLGQLNRVPARQGTQPQFDPRPPRQPQPAVEPSQLPNNVPAGSQDDVPLQPNRNTPGPSASGGAQLTPRAYRILAQVTPTQADRTTSNPATAPDSNATGDNNPNSAVPPPGAVTDRRLINQRRAAGTQSNTVPPDGINGSMQTGSQAPVAIDLGTIQIGTDGSGKLRQRVEGIRVETVVGQSVMVVSATTAGGNAALRENNRAGQPGEATGTAVPQRIAPSGVIASGVIQLVGADTPNPQEPAQDLGANRPVNPPAGGQGQGGTLPANPNNRAPSPPSPPIPAPPAN